MRKSELSFGEIGLIAGTRGMLGAGLGLLLADKVSSSRRKQVGWALFVTGALSTIPLVMRIRKKRLPVEETESSKGTI